MINVLSLFDGISGGQLALRDLGIDSNYYASEIDPYAILVTQHHFPDTIQLGDVRNIKGNDLPQIDLLLGGSPCQNLSKTVINNIKHNTGLRGEHSILFYQFLRLLVETNPKYFLFENVGSMSEENKNTISAALQVEPTLIDSNLVSAQDRLRYYWTNIDVEDIEEDGAILADIVETTVPEKYYYTEDFDYHGDKKVQATLHIKGHDILKRVYNLNGKCGTLTRCTGGNHQKKVFQNGRCRKLTPLEYERLQTLPDNYTAMLSDSRRYDVIGNGWTIEVIKHILKYATFTN